MDKRRTQLSGATNSVHCGNRSDPATSKKSGEGRRLGKSMSTELSEAFIATLTWHTEN
jgi:hypothetical protein